MCQGVLVQTFHQKLDVQPDIAEDLLPQHLVAECEAPCSPFMEEEIRHVVFSLVGDKAPVPYGFLMIFFQKCWDIIKEGPDLSLRRVLGG